MVERISRKNLSIFKTSRIRVFEAIVEEKSIDWLTFGYFISFYSHSFEEQTNYLGNIREFMFFFFFELLLNIEEKVGQVSCLV